VSEAKEEDESDEDAEKERRGAEFEIDESSTETGMEEAERPVSLTYTGAPPKSGGIFSEILSGTRLDPATQGMIRLGLPEGRSGLQQGSSLCAGGQSSAGAYTQRIRRIELHCYRHSSCLWEVCVWVSLR